MTYRFLGIDHVQLAAPQGCEAEARASFSGLLGWEEVQKPESLRQRGGSWFQCGTHQVHDIKKPSENHSVLCQWSSARGEDRAIV